jgi:hypothetical protein
MWDTDRKQASTNLAMGYAGGGEPILGLGLHLNSRPWRLGPAWAVLAGALACQAPVWGGESLLRLGGSVLLADALWGIFWRRPSSAQGAQPRRENGVGLPYTSARSPMMAVFSGLRWEGAADTETGWQGAMAGLGLVAVLSVLLGSWAIVLSVLALTAAVIVRVSLKRGRQPVVMMALLGTGLPWALGATLGGSGDIPSLGRLEGDGLALGVTFTALTWAVLRAECSVSRDLAWPIWIAQIGILAALMAFRASAGMAIVAACFVAPCLWISSRPCRFQEGAATVRNSNLWWLASMLAAAFAVRY